MFRQQYLIQTVYNWNRVKSERYRNGDIVIKLGYLRVMKEPYIKLEYSYKTIDYAAKNGHLNIIKWLHESSNNCKELL